MGSIVWKFDDVDPSTILGPWFSDQGKINSFHELFCKAKPFPHVVISNFFSQEFATTLEAQFPIPKGSSAEEWKTDGWNVLFI